MLTNQLISRTRRLSASRPKRRRLVAGLCATGALFLLTGLSASPAAAYSGCWGPGPNVNQGPNILWGTTWCHNYASYRTVHRGAVTGYLYAGNNWFICQQRFGENPRPGSARNNWWLYTQGDVGYRESGWGWFPATYVSGGGNYQPIPGLRGCSWSDGLVW